MLRGDIVKDDSGSCAALTEQGSSASQNDGRKRNGCHSKAARVSACIQVKMEDAPGLLKLPKARHRWPTSWSNIKEPVVPLERHQYGHPLRRPVVGKTI